LVAFGKTKAGAEFLARIRKVEKSANHGKAKIAETFSGEAANLARKRLVTGLIRIGANTPLPA
jgi:hypothetical protein